MPPPAAASSSRLSQLFGIDLRTLAAVRIGLAMLLIVDLCNRSRDLEAHYTDFGVLPRDVLISEFAEQWQLSLHMLNGTVVIQTALFLIAGVVALLMLLGYRTRVMTFLSWLFLISLHARNPVILQGGDIVLRCLMFWAMFLPLGAVYSIDRALATQVPELPQRLASVRTAALLLQVGAIYWFTVGLKSHDIWFPDGTAVYYTLSIDQFATHLGKYLLNFPWLLQLMTYLTLVVEWTGPTLAFVPWRTARLRCLIVPMMIGLHVSFTLCMQLGLFSWIMVVAWVGFLPGEFWDGLLRRWRRSDGDGYLVYYDAGCGFCRKLSYLIRTFLALPALALREAQSDPAIHAEMEAHNTWILVDPKGRHYHKVDGWLQLVRISPLRFVLGWMAWRPIAAIGAATYYVISHNRRWFSYATRWMHEAPLLWKPVGAVSVFVVLCVLYALAWNIRTLNFEYFVKYFPRRWNWVGDVTRIDQKWGMFAPFPTREDGWYVIPATLKDGTEIDLWNGGEPVRWAKPAHVVATYANQRWRKYMMNMWQKDYAAHRLHFGRYQCRAWNRDHPRVGDKLTSFEIYFMEEFTQPNYQEPTIRKVKLWSHDCFKVGE